MQHVDVCDSVNRSIDGYKEEESRNDKSQSIRDSWHHLSARQCLNQQDEWHNCDDIMVTRERRQPLDGKVMHPNYQNRQVDRRDGPKHQDEDRVHVVVEIVVGDAANLRGEAVGACAGRNLNETCNEVSKLIWDECCDEEEEHAGCNEAAASGRRAKSRRTRTAFLGLAKKGRLAGDEVEHGGGDLNDDQCGVVHCHAETDTNDAHKWNQEPEKWVAGSE